MMNTEQWQALSELVQNKKNSNNLNEDSFDQSSIDNIHVIAESLEKVANSIKNSKSDLYIIEELLKKKGQDLNKAGVNVASMKAGVDIMKYILQNWDKIVTFETTMKKQISKPSLWKDLASVFNPSKW